MTWFSSPPACAELTMGPAPNFQILPYSLYLVEVTEIFDLEGAAVRQSDVWRQYRPKSGLSYDFSLEDWRACRATTESQARMGRRATHTDRQARGLTRQICRIVFAQFAARDRRAPPAN